MNYLDLTPQGEKKTKCPVQRNDDIICQVDHMEGNYPRRRSVTNFALLFFIALLTLPALFWAHQLNNIDHSVTMLISADDYHAHVAYQKHLEIETYLARLHMCESSQGQNMWNKAEDSTGHYMFHLPSDTLSDLTEQFYGYRIESREVQIAVAQNYQEAHAITYLAIEDGQQWRWANCDRKINNGEYDHVKAF